MTTDTKLPHCPRCGHSPKRPMRVGPSGNNFYAPWCDACGFHIDGDCSFGSDEDAAANWTRAVRAELARQALEMRAHSAATQNMSHGCSLFTLSETVLMVTNDYEWLGSHPIRLPGEDA